ncbi:hypothetical protein GQ53DRAFT_201178 [Thozetella sp. PMI_491]|nr:hypothetical protein GQ53DRAFT_201178 [Thozetella sp. PMI_491]
MSRQMVRLNLIVLLAFAYGTFALYSADAIATPSLLLNGDRRVHNNVLENRATTALSTCGYLNGDPTKPRTAESGFVCRIDTAHGIYGFCPTTVIVATDCGLGGACLDQHACSKGCGITSSPGITTWTWYARGHSFPGHPSIKYTDKNLAPIPASSIARQPS